jgi:uncharacterized protein YkwD
MNVFNSKSTSALAALFAAVALTACGGGGGDTPGGSPAPAPAPAPAAPSVGLITSPATPGSGVDTETVAAFNTLNDQRAQCGFGRLNWNTALETAALGHANWNLVNNFSGHFQTAGTPGFTGIGFEDRYVAAGLSGFTGTDENTDLVGTNAKTGFGAFGIRALLSAPYHARGVLAGYTNVGMAVRNATDAGSVHGARVTLQVNPMYINTTGPQKPTGAAANAVRTYPCAGVTGTAKQLDGENPSPLPLRNLGTNPIGHPVFIEAVDSTANLVVTSASITPTAGGAAVALLTNLTSTNDPNGRLSPNQVFLMPDLPLSANTSYTVSISGTVNGAAFSTTFTWTTGS